MSSIAYLTSVFPGLTHTFIYKEVVGLRDRGLSIYTFSMRKPKLRDLSRDESIDLYKSTTYLLPPKIEKLLKGHLFFCVTNPKKYVGLLFFLMTREFKKKLKDRFRTLCHFGEGVYLASLISSRNNIDHIHAHYASQAATVAMVAAILAGKSFSFTAHAHDIWLDKLFLKEKVNAAKFVIACSEFGRTAILKLDGIVNPCKVKRVYHGVNVRKFRPIERKRVDLIPIFLNVGRLCKEKAQDNLVKACRILKEEGYLFKCNIVGEGPLRNYLEEMIKENKLEGIVNLVGRVFQQDINSYYTEADIFVLSSVSENLPNVLLESAAAGLPIVASNLSGIPELIQNGVNGLLVKPGNVNELAEAMATLLNHKELREKFSDKGLDLISVNFDEEQCLDQLAEVLKLGDVQGV